MCDFVEMRVGFSEAQLRWRLLRVEMEPGGQIANDFVPFRLVEYFVVKTIVEHDCFVGAQHVFVEKAGACVPKMRAKVRMKRVNASQGEVNIPKSVNICMVL